MVRFGKAMMLALLAAGTAQGALAQTQPDALAKAFGARETVISASLSPDGSKIALVSAGPGRSSRAYVLEARKGAELVAAATTSGNPDYMSRCDWVAAARLACQIYSETRYADDVYGSSNVFAVDASGGNTKLLSQRRGQNALS